MAKYKILDLFCKAGGGEYNEEWKWQPNREGLGLGKVLDYIGVDY